MNPKDIGPEIPSAQDLAAFAKEYFKSYMEAIEEKKPPTYPKFAQEAPYHIRSYLLPNGCVCMVFTSAQELKIEGATKNWDEVQELIVKGVDHFAGFFPFEGRALGDWNKRGRRDAHRDIRLMDKSQLSRIGAELEELTENVTKIIKANFWIDKSGSMQNALGGLRGRIGAGFPTVDAIATLQSLKTYSPGNESVTIEFPDKEVLQEISDGLKSMSSVQEKLDLVESRVFEIEKSASSPDQARSVTDMQDRVDRLEKQLEKVSNILTMLNSKVETYFSKTAEKERQADLEKRIEEHTSKALSHESKISEMEKEAEELVGEIRKMMGKVEKDVQESRKRIARLEKHFVDFAKLMQE